MSQAAWPGGRYGETINADAAYHSLPSQRPVALDSGDFVRAVSELPDCLQPVFSGSFRYFNTVQSETFPTAYGSDVNMVVAAPTGSGKTGVMELAILRLISVYIDQHSQFVLKPGSLKIVYLAPIRALVQEKVKQWQQTFGSKLGLSCCELTGDTDMADKLHLENADIICTTPEKFDAVTRTHKDQGGMQFFSEVALVLIDEVHLLSENRGSALETGTISRIKMVSSMKEMSQLPIARVRFVAVSATIPNIQDIADWLQVPPAGLKAFGEEVRPVKLRTVVKGYAPTKTDFLFERRLNDYIHSVIAEYSKSKPSLVFCSSRKGTVDTAMHLLSVISKSGRGYIRDRNHHDKLQRIAATSSNRQLQQTLQAGIAFHNAGMEASERAQVEELFLARDVLVLCTTSTLAMGVNLPAHLVVLKGTRRWSSDAGETAGYQEYDRSTCLQMIGRAGRPQFDTEGVAVIMTQKQLVSRYQNLMHGAELVESQLKESFSEYLNAEIALRTVTDVSVAISWLKGSFFYIRVRKNPAAYGIPSNRLPEAAVEKVLKDQLILSNVKELTKYGMVQSDEYGFALEPLVPGQLMARHYIRFKTMIAISETFSTAGMPELLMTIARSAEFSGIKLRRSEKKALNAINKGSRGENGKGHAIKFCVTDPHKPQKTKERISTGPEKIFIMVNEGLSDSPADLLDFSMKQELEQVLKVGERIALCMSKYFAHVGRLTATANSMLLHKSLKNRMWGGSRHVTRQLPGIGNLLAERLAAAGIDHLHKLQDADPRRIETVTQRHYPFGNQVKEELRSRMPPAFSLDVVALRRLSGGRLELEITLTRDSNSASSHCRTYAKLIAGSLHDDCLLLHESLVLEHFPSPYTVKFATRSPLPADAQAVTVVTSVLLDRLIGLDATKKLIVPKTAKLQSVAPSSTEGQQTTCTIHQQDPISSMPLDQGPQQLQTGHAQTEQQHSAFQPGAMQQADASGESLRHSVQRSFPGQHAALPSVAPPEQAVGLQQRLVRQVQRSQGFGLDTVGTATAHGVNRPNSLTAARSTSIFGAATTGGAAMGPGAGPEGRTRTANRTETATETGAQTGHRPRTAAEIDSGIAAETAGGSATHSWGQAGSRKGSEAADGFGIEIGRSARALALTESNVPTATARKPRRKLVHTVRMLPGATSSSSKQGCEQPAASLPALHPGQPSTNRSQMASAQAQGMHPNLVKGHPENLLLQQKPAQQPGLQPSHQYPFSAPQMYQHQPPFVEHETPDTGARHGLAESAEEAFGADFKQRGSPPVSSHTADFSRFNLSALPSSRKRSASETPPDQQTDPGSGQGPFSGMFNFVRSKAKKLQGSTPGSNMSSSSFFGGRQPSSAVLCRTATNSSSPSLLSKLSESQIASRSFAPVPQNPTHFSWPSQQDHGYQQPLVQPPAQPEACRPPSGLPSRTAAPVDWSSYLADDTVHDRSDAAGMPQGHPPSCGGLVSVFDQPWCDEAQHDVHSDMSKPHRKSPMDAKLQALIPGPSQPHASRMQQQQQREDVQSADTQASKATSSFLPGRGATGCWVSQQRQL